MSVRTLEMQFVYTLNPSAEMFFFLKQPPNGNAALELNCPEIWLFKVAPNNK